MRATGCTSSQPQLWAGGLVFLLIALWRAHSEERWHFTARAVPRFSALAVVSIATLLIAGVINGFLEVGSWRGLWETTYGQLLLVKAALVLPVLALGAFNNRVSVPRLRAKIASALERRRFLRIRCRRARPRCRHRRRYGGTRRRATGKGATLRRDRSGLTCPFPIETIAAASPANPAPVYQLRDMGDGGGGPQAVRRRPLNLSTCQADRAPSDGVATRSSRPRARSRSSRGRGGGSTGVWWLVAGSACGVPLFPLPWVGTRLGGRPGRFRFQRKIRPTRASTSSGEDRNPVWSGACGLAAAARSIGLPATRVTSRHLQRGQARRPAS